VPERCTCGAQLPEDALFCHKCGKPQREFVSVDEPEPAAPPPIPIVIAKAVEPPAISFHNGTAVRIALSMGLLAFLCLPVVGRLPAPQAFTFVFLAAAGFLAVVLYRRRTGERLSVVNGARLGWISGIFGFAIVTIILTFIAIALSEPSVVAQLREQTKTGGAPDAATLEKIIQAVHNPADLSSIVGLSFLLFTVLPAFGGAVGAKLLDRD
jgi:hypothetical protein